MANTVPLLVVSPTPFLPTNAGNRARIRNLIEALRQGGYDVHFLHVGYEAGDADAMAARLAPGHFRAIPYHRPPRHETRGARIGRQFRQLFDSDVRHSWKIDDWYDPTITDTVIKWHREVKFQVVIVEYVFFSALFDSLPSDVVKILDTHDRFTLRHRLYLAQGVEPKFFTTTYPEEARGLSRADLILAIQDGEREAFARMSNKPVITLGHVVHIENCLSQRSDKEAPRLLIVGSNNDINVDGLNRFLAEDWPEIKKRLPATQLLVAGGLSKSVPVVNGLKPLGLLDDIAEAYRQAHIVINPVRRGTGLNIKSIEALGYGMPLISTPAGCRGIESEIGHSIVLAEGPEQTGDAVEGIWNNPVWAQHLNTNALVFAQNWNKHVFAVLNSFNK